MMSKYHLLTWIFKALDNEGRLDFTENNFKSVNAPEWVWPTYQEKLKEYAELKEAV